MFPHTIDCQDKPWLSMLLLLPLFLSSVFLIRKWRTPPKPSKNLPPSPPKLPIIGNLHQLGLSPHAVLHSLARNYGPVMLLHLGNVPFLVISSADAAREALKTHDPIFSNRPKSSVAYGIYECKDIAFSPYGEYWRQVKSICVTQLLSNRRVQSFRNVREEEISLVIEKIRVSCWEKSVVNLSETFASLANDVICRVALGRKYGEGGVKFKKVLEELGVLLGAFDVGEFIPWLFWVKYLNGMKGKLREIARDLDEFLEMVLREHMDEGRKREGGGEGGENRKDFVDVLLEIQGNEEGGFVLDAMSVKALILVEPLLYCQDLQGFIDGTLGPPAERVSGPDNTSIPNPKFLEWRQQDQRIKSLLLSSLTEETMPEVLGCPSARAVWVALETAFSNSSKSKEISLKDELQLMKKGSRSIADYGRQFKLLCDQLAAIGRPVDETDKSHWFLRGLGPAFSGFSAAQLSLTPLPSFRDLLSKAESYDLFQQSLDGSTSSSSAFTAATGSSQGRGRGRRSTNSQGRGSSNRGRNSSGRGGGGGRGFRRPPKCQICREEDHYADKCPERFSRVGTDSANLAQAFQSACNIQSPQSSSDWFVDSGASAHMTPSSSGLDSLQNYHEPQNSAANSNRSA